MHAFTVGTATEAPAISDIFVRLTALHAFMHDLVRLIASTHALYFTHQRTCEM